MTAGRTLTMKPVQSLVSCRAIAAKIRRKRLWLTGMVGAGALVLAACSSSASPASAPAQGPPAKGGTATFGMISGQTPNWFWPFDPIAYQSIPNQEDFQELLYRPLYVFGNNGTS